MKYTLYEEYPTEKNIEKLGCIDFPVNLMLASPSLEEFYRLQSQVKSANPNVQNIGYWPTLSTQEGYWMSPLSDRKGLERVIKEIKERPNNQEPLNITWDAELPLLVNAARMLTGIPGFYQNKRLIQEFLQNYEDYNLNIETAELPNTLVPEFLQKALGVSFEPIVYDTTQVKMFYTSFLRSPLKKVCSKKRVKAITKRLLKREAEKGLRKYQDRFSMGLGCIVSGLFGNEPILSPEEFAEDIATIKNAGVKKAHIYRLGGITPEYSDVMRKYCTE